MRNFNLNEMVDAYAVCALWSSTDDEGDPLDDVYGTDDIAPETMQSMRADCEDFVKSNHDDLIEYCTKMKTAEWSGEQRAGHDFWLTRNGHGAGFWDRGLGDLGERLSAASKVYGSVDLYVGDDEQVHS